MIDPHCPNVIMFHFALREKITNHDLVKSFKLIIQVFLQNIFNQKEKNILSNILFSNIRINQAAWHRTQFSSFCLKKTM